jgi:hypothetical protein
MGNKMFKVGQIINFDGDKWEVGAVGVERDGATYLHLWSVTRTLLTQKNGGKVPVNACAFVPNEISDQ